MKIVFFGSDDFAAAHFEYLVQHKYNVIGCVTQPDRPKGRGMKMILSPVKEIALKNKITVLQPDNLKLPAVASELDAFKADLFVVIAYGRILPRKILELPKWMAVNVHGSLLPQYRGAAPINWAIINGETKTGLTIIKLNPQMDAGDIIAREEIAIGPDTTSVTLRADMISKGCPLLVKTIDYIKGNKITLTRQDEARVTLAPKLTRELGVINWTKQSALEIHNLVRGLLPWPCAESSINGTILKILKTDVLKGPQPQGVPGQVLAIGKQGISVAARSGALLIQELHPHSSKKMTADEFVRGYPVKLGDVFGG